MKKNLNNLVSFPSVSVASSVHAAPTRSAAEWQAKIDRMRTYDFAATPLHTDSDDLVILSRMRRGAEVTPEALEESSILSRMDKRMRDQVEAVRQNAVSQALLAKAAEMPSCWNRNVMINIAHADINDMESLNRFWSENDRVHAYVEREAALIGMISDILTGHDLLPGGMNNEETLIWVLNHAEAHRQHAPAEIDELTWLSLRQNPEMANKIRRLNGQPPL